MFIVLLVCFIVVMLLWALSKSGAVAVNSDWMAFIACLILGIVVFLYAGGVIVVERPAFR